MNNTVILTVKAGSHSYGTNTEDSDIDERSVTIITDPRYYFGFHHFEQSQSLHPIDTVTYDIRKWLKLVCAANPACLEMLFVRDCDILYIDELGQTLRDNRQLFLTEKIRHTFGGYAKSSMTRILKKTWSNIDYKDASHLIRLLETSIETLKTGELNVYRQNHAQLLDIRRGKWNYSKIIDYANELDAKLKETISVLPAKIDTNKIEQLQMDLIVKAFQKENVLIPGKCFKTSQEDTNVCNMDC